MIDAPLPNAVDMKQSAAGHVAGRCWVCTCRRTMPAVEWGSREPKVGSVWTDGHIARPPATAAPLDGLERKLKGSIRSIKP